MDSYLKIWGSRGGVPASGPEFNEMGHATICIELSLPSQTVIFDAGSGIAPLGEHIISKEQSPPITLLIGHYHVDHLMGLPFFRPIYSDQFQVTCHLPNLAGGRGRKSLARFFAPPLFPVELDALSSTVKFREFNPGENFSLGEDLQCRTMLLEHPGGNTGYRVYNRSVDVTVMTDVENIHPEPLAQLIRFAKDTRYLLLDSSYSSEQIKTKRGWGHLSVDDVGQIASALPTTTILMIHHDVMKPDVQVRSDAAQVMRAHSNLVLCRETESYHF